MTKQTRIQKHLDNLSELTQENNVRYADGTEYNIYDLKELMSKELVAIEEIQEEEQAETALTVEELKSMGELLADARETMELYNHALQLVPHGSKLSSTDLAIYYQSLYELIDTMFLKNQKIMKNLDNVAYLLSENDNEVEIKNVRERFN